MVKNLFFLETKNNTISNSSIQEVSEIDNNQCIVPINYTSKKYNTPDDLLKNIYKLLKTHKINDKILHSSKNLYMNDDAICMVYNDKVVCYGNYKYGGNCIYHIINPKFITPAPTRFISGDLNNIYVWGSINYTFNNISAYLKIAKWNIIVNNNNGYYIFNDNKNKLIQSSNYKVKNKDGVRELLSHKTSDEVVQYIRAYILKKILDKVNPLGNTQL